MSAVTFMFLQITACSCNNKFYIPVGITEQILCTSENLELLKRVQQRYKHSDVVQMNVSDISSKYFHGFESKCMITQSTSVL